jgi:hypothetical protein
VTKFKKRSRFDDITFKNHNRPHLPSIRKPLQRRKWSYYKEKEQNLKNNFLHVEEVFVVGGGKWKIIILRISYCPVD